MMEKAKEIVQKATSRQRVYDFLKMKILDLHIKPGEIINLGELEDYLKLSRSPIRDALIQLENEGLVNTIPQRGTGVTKINSSRVDDERFLRSCLEEKIIIEFLDVYTETHLQELYSIIEQQKAVLEIMNFRKFLSLDDLFHSVFYKATNHFYCLETVQNLSSNYYRLRLLSISERNIMAQVITEHEEILKLIKNREEELLVKLLARHITEKDDEVNTIRTKYSDLFTEPNEEFEDNTNIFEEDFLKLSTLES